jgi:hypothetical protein
MDVAEEPNAELNRASGVEEQVSALAALIVTAPVDRAGRPDGVGAVEARGPCAVEERAVLHRRVLLLLVVDSMANH